MHNVGSYILGYYIIQPLGIAKITCAFQYACRFYALNTYS